MSKYDFTKEEFDSRHAAVRRVMAAKNLSYLIVIAPANIQYLIGTRTKSYQEFQCLLFPLDPSRPKVVLTRLAEVAEFSDLSLADEVYGWGGREPEDSIEALQKVLNRHGYDDMYVGLEIPCYYLSVQDHAKIAALLEEKHVTDATSLIEEIKLVKSPAEIKMIRKTTEIALETMQAATDAIRVGVSEREVAAEIYRNLLARGGDLPASPVNFTSGERTCYGHGAPTDRRLQAGDYINLEFGAAYNRYCTTIGRQIVLGEPSARMVELYETVRRATDACIEMMHAGTPAVVPHRAAKKVISDRGLDKYRVHTTGYGIAPGYPPSWGESIHMFEDSTYTLAPGMVLSVEPPVLIHEERLGARLIDNVLIRDDGPEILTTFERGLIILPC
ncbi:M24 family metallopeptidase [Rhizobium mongolense]|uniref:Xaa-Pro dipeptidase n=1 Tax=Rhizobium mongolense TaxID=57676 RepID=A0A7W6RS21_9HYPH|nr:Xaa-Pro peptidase family protein [Rhizobium mongolense]MBB4277614.1 Xaa-Pro dipeptidase [Rhizobium mongolense]